MILLRFLSFLFLLLLPLPACDGEGGPVAGDGVAVAGAVPSIAPSAGSGSARLDVVFSTSTPWPTFTPVPTAVPSPPLVSTSPPSPTATPWPRFSPRRELEEDPEGWFDVIPVPSPVPGSGLEGSNIFLEKQVLTPFRGGELPDYLVERDWDRMPAPAPVVSSGIRYMLWVVAFDFAGAAPDREVQGMIRWWSAPPGVDPVVMFEAPFTLSARSSFFYHGLGRDEPGFWRPGFYRVEFLDGLGEVAVQSEFEVRR